VEDQFPLEVPDELRASRLSISNAMRAARQDRLVIPDAVRRAVTVPSAVSPTPVPKRAGQIEVIREAGALADRILDRLETESEVGRSLAELHELADAALRAERRRESLTFSTAQVSFLLNHQVAAGEAQPQRLLKDGDLLKTEVACSVNGYWALAARSWPVGQGDRESRVLCEATRQACWEAAIAAQKGMPIGAIGFALERTIVGKGLSVIPTLSSGIGQDPCEAPFVVAGNPPDEGYVLRSGLTLVVYAAAKRGSPALERLRDGFTVTADQGEAAVWALTIAIRDRGTDVLTTAAAAQ
jgi:methionyl aminopeptidase